MQPTPTPPPCRLFVIPARDAPVAAVLRRGPSDWYQVIRWDLARDVLTDGAWFKGRIYEERCDVSPDGALLLAFCHGGGWRPGYTNAWTAVSRLPWLHALALWPSGTTYGGGGRFVDDRTLILRQAASAAAHPDHLPHGLTVREGIAERHASSGEIEGAEWSGRDHRGSAIFSRDGRLYRRDGFGDHEIADLNGRTPNPVESPDAARRPLSRGRA